MEIKCHIDTLSGYTCRNPVMYYWVDRNSKFYCCAPHVFYMRAVLSKGAKRVCLAKN